MTHKIILLVLTAFALQPVYLHAADEGSKKIPETSKEERITKAEKFEKMAEAHKHMAECLRSDKHMSECHESMMKECPKTKDGHCPMMDEMGWKKALHPRKHGKNNDD